MIDHDYIVFIVTHGRPENVKTYRNLRKHGYRGRIVLVVDDLDESVEKYKQIYGKQVYVFSKQKYIDLTDSADNFSEKRAVVYARNACFDIAEDLGFKYFIVLDDDYRRFAYKFKEDFSYGDISCRSLDDAFALTFEYFKSAPFKSIAWAQGGDFIGGGANDFHKTLGHRRKVMNSFFCSTERRFQFCGKINEDLTTSVMLGNRGDLFLTFPLLSVQQIDTQQNAGGLTDIYLALGTYIKSFYSVMFQPSCVKVSVIGDGHDRIHHAVTWVNAVPMIIDEKWRKRS